jgi:hypothetical protein
VTGTSCVLQAKAAVDAHIKLKRIHAIIYLHFLHHDIIERFQIVPILAAVKHAARSLRDLVVALVLPLCEEGNRDDFNEKAIELYGGSGIGLYDNVTRSQLLLQYHRIHDTRGTTHGIRPVAPRLNRNE